MFWDAVFLVLLSKLVSEHARQSCSETILETTLQKHCIPQTSELPTTSQRDNHERDLAREHNPETKEAFLTYISLLQVSSTFSKDSQWTPCHCPMLLHSRSSYLGIFQIISITLCNKFWVFVVSYLLFLIKVSAENMYWELFYTTKSLQRLVSVVKTPLTLNILYRVSQNKCQWDIFFWEIWYFCSRLLLGADPMASRIL